MFFAINTPYGMQKFDKLVVSDEIKEELEKINIEGIEFIRMRAFNHTKQEHHINLWMIKIKCFINYMNSDDPANIPPDFHISVDSENRMFVSEKVKEIFINGGLDHFTYKKLDS